MTAIGDIVDYVVTDADVTINGSQTTGETVPLMVVSVNDDDGTYSGIAFTLNGTFNVHVPPPEADPVPPTVEEAISKLDPTQRAELLAELQKSAPPAPVEPAPAPVNTPDPNAGSPDAGITGTVPPATFSDNGGNQ